MILRVKNNSKFNILVNTKVTSVLALECHKIRDLITDISYIHLFRGEQKPN